MRSGLNPDVGERLEHHPHGQPHHGGRAAHHLGHQCGAEALHATRMLRAALHGFIGLERAGGFAMELDVNESFERLIDIVDQGLESQVIVVDYDVDDVD